MGEAAFSQKRAQGSWANGALNYVRQRWAGWVFIGVLAFGALWSARVALQSKPFDVRAAKGPSLKHEPDFEATRLDAWRTNAEGTSRTHIVAEKAVHYRDDLSSTYVKPRFSLLTATAQTEVSANAATVRNDGEEVAFNGSVLIQRKRTAAGQTPSTLTLEAKSVTLYPDSGVATSRDAVVFKQGSRSVAAKGGFDYRDTEAQIELLGAVQAIVMPVKSKQK